MKTLTLRCGQYNLLCPAYGVKWGEREACDAWVSKQEHGGSNWSRRWPALRRVLDCAEWDVLALQELEANTFADVQQGLMAQGLELLSFPHPGREDALGIAYRTATSPCITLNVHVSPLTSPRSVTQSTRQW